MHAHAIVLPGGGYRLHAPHEAEPVAEWLRALGLDASVLRYPVGQPHPAADDAIRSRVASLRAAGVARILLVGFSAGGHAAGLAALGAPDAEIDAAILVYPVVSLERRPHAGSTAVLLGGGDTAEHRAELSLERLVGPSTPPLLLVHALDDATVSVEHTFALSAALRAADRPHELVVFPHGGHGFALGGPDQPWTPLAEQWLRAVGMTTPNPA